MRIIIEYVGPDADNCREQTCGLEAVRAFRSTLPLGWEIVNYDVLP